MQPAPTAPPSIEELALERLLGRGATGEVWLARDTLLERPVAVKIALGVPGAEEACAALEAMKPRAAEEGVDAGGNPYRGLLAFGPEHRALFFGRDAEAASVLAEMRAAPLVLVVGASGAGKSSLVRAGVLPRVERGALGPGEWKSAVMVPSSRPIERLAQALSPVLGAGEEQVAERARAEPSWLAERAAGAGKRLALLVDQLDEAWTLSGADRRAALFAALGALAAAGRGVRVVATLRADFLDRLEDMGELQAQALRAPIVLGPLGREGAARAIAEPARRRGVEVESALVESAPLAEQRRARGWAWRRPCHGRRSGATLASSRPAAPTKQSTVGSAFRWSPSSRSCAAGIAWAASIACKRSWRGWGRPRFSGSTPTARCWPERSMAR